MALVDRSIDVDALEFDHEGVRQFLFPLARAEVVAMRDAAMHALAAAARSAQDDSSASDEELLSILLPGFLTEAMRLYEIHALKRRFGALGYRLVTRKVGRRPLIELHPADHPLVAEQQNGITMERVREIATEALHQE